MEMSESEKRIPVMIDRTKYNFKHVNYTDESGKKHNLIGRIKYSMIKNSVTYMTAREIYAALTDGMSIAPARLDGGMRAENWREQALFMVDFDGGVSLEEARKRYEEAGIFPAFAYRSFSHSYSCEKFRLAFILNEVVKNGSVRDKIMATLIGLSGGADAKCTDRARYFNGTNKGGEFYGDTVEVSDVLALWDDDYTALLPSSKSSEKASKKSVKPTKVKRDKKPKRSYEVEVSNNIIPFSTGLWRINAKHNLAMLDRFFEIRNWVEGDHRERFIFIYYNLSKLLYGAEEAFRLVEEKAARMEEPLDQREIYWAIKHTEEHVETNMPELHGDGVFLFNRETIAGDKWLDMTDDECEGCGIFKTREKNERADRNRSAKKERDELVSSLFEAGRTPREIKKVLDAECGENTLSMRSIQRMRHRGCAGESDKIPPTKIYFYINKNSYPPKATGEALSPSQERFLDSLLNGRRNLLLTGEAGSGKSYVLRQAIDRLKAAGKAVAVSAATGMAAAAFDNTSTFHRLFQMDADGYVYREHEAMDELAGYDVLIVDEASMIKAAHMESAICLFREIKKRYHKAPRLVLSFDLMQLPPVNGGYFFEADNFGSLNFECHYLAENFRQDGDTPFTRALNFLRTGQNIGGCCQWLNAMCSHIEDAGAVYLYARKRKAEAKNAEVLRRLPGKEIDLGNIRVKVGCEVIITENARYNSKQAYYNGQRGVLEQVQAHRVGVRTRDGQLTWLYKKYLLDGKGHPVLGSDGQPMRGYPLTLAYAITIHKAQGMTLDKANIDPDCFADGQLYVALSRVKNRGGVHLLGNLRERDCKVSGRALAFDAWLREESSRTAV